MELKLGKKKIKVRKKWLVIGGIAVVIVVVGTAVIVINKNKQSFAFTMNTMSATVETGSISTTIEGTGTLANDSAIDIEIPSGLEIEEVRVNSGDEVKAGDVLATVDEQSLVAELASIEEQIQDKDNEINSTSSGTTTDTIKAKISGRIKKIFAEVDDNVADVMVENEALMLISLDGKMAVDIETSQDLSVNDSVDVVLSDDTTITGTVATKIQSGYTITVTDNGTDYNESVTAKDNNGNTIGTGILYIHQELKVIGTKGTVSKVNVSENTKVSSDTTLVTLTGDFNSATYETLLKERSSLEKQCLVLLSILQNGGIVADKDGVITAVNISEQSSGTSTSSGDAKTMGMSSISENTVVLLTSSASDIAVSRLTSVASDITDIDILEGFNVATPVTGENPQTKITETDNYTGKIVWNLDADTFMDQTTYSAYVELTAKEGYHFSETISVTMDNAVVSGVKISTETEGNVLGFMLTFSKTGSNNMEMTEQTDNALGNSISGTAVDAQQLSNSQSAGGSGGVSSYSSGSSSSSSNSSSSSSSSDDSEDMIAAFSIASSENMLVTISVDELDILSVAVGQKTTLTLDAIPNEIFEGQITSVSREGTSNGGTTKYKVEITLPKNENMIAGMNVSATIIIAESTDVLLVPATAVQERGNRTFVYTQEGSDGMLSGEVEVETGNSDGTNIEIKSGLNSGDTVYYQMATTSDTETMEGFPMQGGGMMGGMGGNSQDSSGERPSGAPSGGGFPGGDN